VTYHVVWAEPAIDTAAGYLSDDAEGLSTVMDRIDDLAIEPTPKESSGLGSSGLRRLHVGRYRVLYEIDEEEQGLTIIHIGRLG
jgi:mRNA interferase RelE/StbE